MLNKYIDRVYKDRYKRVGKYKFDKLIFNIYFLLFLLCIVFIFKTYGYDLNYFECIAPHEGAYAECVNPFYKPSTWENEKILPVGKYGVNIMPAIDKLEMFAVFGFVFALIINHVIYNKNFKINK